jgi:hypothetical protein
VEKESEELLAKLKLLLEGKLVQSLVNLRLLAEVKVDLSLLRLGFLLGQGEIEPLEGLKLLVELMGSFLVKLELPQKMNLHSHMFRKALYSTSLRGPSFM